MVSLLIRTILIAALTLLFTAVASYFLWQLSGVIWPLPLGFILFILKLQELVMDKVAWHLLQSVGPQSLVTELN